VKYLRSLGRGELSHLRHAAGRSIGNSREIYSYIFPHIPEHAGEDRKKAMFSLATLFAVHPTNSDEGNFGDHYRFYSIRSGRNAPTEERFKKLIELRDLDRLALNLRFSVDMLRSAKIPVNWAQLLDDLTYWNSKSTKYSTPAYRWAEAFWRGPD
jgi:CRISPR type I-E-associated protein CasB/Cse2